MVEPEAELQATANLSPVSPSPVHTAAPLVVSSLQDTVDTIDAMVAAVARAAEGSAQENSLVDPALVESAEVDDVVDDDSLNDPYNEEAEPSAAEETRPQIDSADNRDDDYAKTFDSPIEAEGGDAQDTEPHVSPSDAQNSSNQFSIASAPLSIDHLPTHSTATHDASATLASLPAAMDQRAIAQSDPTAELVVPAQTNLIADAMPGQDRAAQNEPTDGAESIVMDAQSASSLDIQRLVADLTAQSDEPKSDNDVARSEPPTGSVSLASSAALPSPASLPPRPPQPHSTTPSYASQHHLAAATSGAPASAAAAHASTGQMSSYHIGGAPGTTAEAAATFPGTPAAGLNATSYPVQAPAYPVEQSQDVDHTVHWEQFLNDERQYMSEAKWDRFPDGSRIFIGNLSSDKVSKRDVFDLFHKYGRLAQISLKSAYGFVQYHTVEEGRRAMDNLQDTELKGRCIHLEISRVQDKSKKDRHRSPDRGRGRDGGRKNDKHGHSGRDDYRPGRNHSPRRNDHHHSRDDGFSGRDRGYNDNGRNDRGRSRSPRYGRAERDGYRRRSPSPQGRQRHEPELEFPRRYGADVPDVQMILQPEVDGRFVEYIDGTLKTKGLKTDVMRLHPRIPKDQIIQRQAAEGVHAIVELGIQAQSTGRIPVQVFDRSQGNSNIRFDQYVDLDPVTASEIILRAKASTATANYGQAYGAAPMYQPQYGGQPLRLTGYSEGHQPVSYAAQQPPPAAASSTAEIARLIGQADPTTLQRLLASMQAQGPSSTVVGGYGHGTNGAASMATNPQVDLQAILGSLGGANTQHAPPQVPYGGASYGGQAANDARQRSAPSNGDSAAQVQNIMAQLARYRQ